MEVPILNDIVIIFALSIGVLFLSHRLRVPGIVGFLLTGLLAGPHGLGLVKAVAEVEVLAEVGVVLLLFTIGIEFSLKALVQIRKTVLVGGSLQVVLTLAVAALIAVGLGRPPGEAIFLGFLISLSSTAIVLKLLQDRAEVDSPHGRTSLAILIYQDVAIVPMMLFTPLLAGAAGTPLESLLALLLKGALIIGLVIVGAEYVVPRVLYQIARTRSRELFLLSIVVICFAVAWLTHAVGLSLALGAFLAGLIISESEYSHQALGNVLPLRDLFASFFFVSVGMLLNLGFLVEQPSLVAVFAVGTLLLKALFAILSTVFLGFPLRTAVLVGLSLSQVGEFSFVLSKAGIEHGLLTGDINQLFLAVSVLSMAATPLIMALGPGFAGILLRLPLPRRLKSGSAGAHIPPKEKKALLKDHLIIIGFGINGRNVARAARVAGIPYVVIETNPDTVRSERESGETIYFGDAVQDEVLRHAGILKARVLVVAISDPVATRSITALARRLNPKLCIIARTRYLQEMAPLHDLGADEVIPEEFETSVEIFTRVLMKYLVPRDEIERFVAEVRSDGYHILRSRARESASLSDLRLSLPDLEISALRIPEGSPLSGKTLAETGLRKNYGVTVVAVRRESDVTANPAGDARLESGDVVVALGSPDDLAGIAHFFKADAPPEEIPTESASTADVLFEGTDPRFE